ERRAVVKLDAFAQFEYPLVALELPGLGEHADEIFAADVVFYQRFDHLLPFAIDRARAVIIRMIRVGDARMKNSDAITRSGVRVKQKIRPDCRAGRESRAAL